jgi:tRNA pseudouridine32 synthase/23S rRNA pseudouridine746 synthase/23S rRNA pseudouridine1911/1915/1917 synthase
MTKQRHKPHGTTILYEDDDMIIVDKIEGLLSVGTGQKKTGTAYHVLTDYIRKGQSRSRKHLYTVHRLDRDTSGILIFAKTELAKKTLQEKWSNIKKIYLAVVHGTPEKKEDTISSYLAENSAYVVYSTSDKTKGRLAHTAYRVIKEHGDRCLLEVDLLTGRKNQIRVHLADIGHPIIGDKKYGARDGQVNRMALHAWKIILPHPTSSKTLALETPVPKCFYLLMGGIL